MVSTPTSSEIKLQAIGSGSRAVQVQPASLSRAGNTQSPLPTSRHRLGAEPFNSMMNLLMKSNRCWLSELSNGNDIIF